MMKTKERVIAYTQKEIRKEFKLYKNQQNTKEDSTEGNEGWESCKIYGKKNS